MAGIGRTSTYRAGVISAVEIQAGTPVPATSPMSSRLNLLADKDSAATWATVWFVAAVVMLYIIL